MIRLRYIKLFFLALISFAVMLVTVNIYEYLKLKNNIAPTLMSQISSIELDEIKSYFTSISEQLNIVKEWGENGVLEKDNIRDLNKLFFPLFDSLESIGALILANNQGDEYVLYQDKQGWITRQSHITYDQKTSLQYKRWTSVDQPTEQWQEPSNNAPGEAPWFFSPDADNEAHWSLIHTFPHTQELGVTAAISWEHSSSSSFTLFGLEIPITNIERFLTLRNTDRPGVIFLVNDSGDLYISSNLELPATKEMNKDRGSEKVMDKMLKAWKAEGRPKDVPINFSKNKQKWLASFQPLEQKDFLFWVGVAAPEKELLTQINSKLFQVDIIDLIIASIGAAILSLLFWKIGLLQSPIPEQPAIVRLNNYINKGEGAGIEFKSTIRTNLKTGKHGKEIELAWLKAIVAFFNSAGGALLIGIDDSGLIMGLEIDGFANKDKCLLHVKNLINHHIGAEFSSSIKTNIIEVEGREVMMIECKHVASAIFLNIGKNEEFYVRSGPSSTKLSPSQTVQFVLQKGKARAGS